MHGPPCAFCSTPLEHEFVDLGMGPLVSAYLRPDELQRMEPFYPLRTWVCGGCFLVQLPPAESPEHIFGEYPYFSSVSESWLRHAERYVEDMVARFGIGAGSRVVEIASNDGYLLQYFQRRGVPVLGIEPARNVARAAVERGIPTLNRFFGFETARQVMDDQGPADLVLGNNVLAHVPDLNDFVGGVKLLLKPGGLVTMEFPHLLRLIEENQFDQIFHEHFSYLSFGTVGRVFGRHDLELFDVEELPTHGGSLRVYARHAGDGTRPVTDRVGGLLARERERGLEDPEVYEGFGRKVAATKHGLLEFLIAAKREGRGIVGYGAPGKGCILLNYCGVRSDFLDYLVDLSPHKQGLHMPGVHVPILHPDEVARTRPDYLLILPWNLKDEIMQQMAHVREWGCRFVVPIPEVQVL